MSRVFLGPLTARPCPRCSRVLRRLGTVLLCPDRTHCLWNGPALAHQTWHNFARAVPPSAQLMVLGVDRHSKLQ